MTHRVLPLVVAGAAGVVAFFTVQAIPRVAAAYPAGEAIALGANPIWSKGGVTSGTAPELIWSNPGPEVLILTDVTLGAQATADCDGSVPFALELSGGTRIGFFAVPVSNGVNGAIPEPLSLHFSSGLPVSPGDTVSVRLANPVGEGLCAGNVETVWTVSGYLGQP